MRRFAALSAALALSPLALAGVVNVEFEFTPYTGELSQDHVQTVPGTARVFVNGSLYVEQEVARDSVPVLFDDRQLAPSLWMTGSSMGPRLRRGKNHIRIEFTPEDAKLAYKGQLHWTQVTDQVTESDDGGGTHTSSNLANEGKEDRPATGKLVMERDFDAGFASDRPWHHYAAITALDDADKAKLLALVRERGLGFKPGFESLWPVLALVPELQVEEIRKHKCLDAAYAAGIRVATVPDGQVEFDTPGGPEVIVHGNKGALYDFGARSNFAKIPGDDEQMCAGMVLSVAFPPRMAFARDPAGHWQQVY